MSAEAATATCCQSSAVAVGNGFLSGGGHTAGINLFLSVGTWCGTSPFVRGTEAAKVVCAYDFVKGPRTDMKAGIVAQSSPFVRSLLQGQQAWLWTSQTVTRGQSQGWSSLGCQSQQISKKNIAAPHATAARAGRRHKLPWALHRLIKAVDAHTIAASAAAWQLAPLNMQAACLAEHTAGPVITSTACKPQCMAAGCNC